MNKELQCSSCKVKYKAEPAKQKRHQELKACDYITPKPRQEYKPTRSMSGWPKINYSTCPANFNNRQISSLIDLVDLYLKGVMPFEGAPENQPAKFVEFVHLIHNLRTEQEQIAKEKLGKRGR